MWYSTENYWDKFITNLLSQFVQVPKSPNRKDKAQAGSAHNWNTLFLGASAVADLMADKYGVSKGDVLSSDSKGNEFEFLAYVNILPLT